MTSKRAGTLWAAAAGAVVLLAALAISYHYAIAIPAARRAARDAAAAGRAAAGGRAAATATQPTAPPELEGYAPETTRANAQAALQRCLGQARLASEAKWNGMCAYVADRNATEFLNCTRRGLTDSYCRSVYASTPVKDCLLPHAMASSLYEAAQSAKGECYRQFQTAMR